MTTETAGSGSELHPLLQATIAYITEEQDDPSELLAALKAFIQSSFNKEENYGKFISKFPTKLREKIEKGGISLESLTSDDLLPAYTDMLNDLWPENLLIPYGLQRDGGKLQDLRTALGELTIDINGHAVNGRPYVGFLLNALNASISEKIAKQSLAAYQADSLDQTDADMSFILGITSLSVTEKVNLYQKLHEAYDHKVVAALAGLMTETLQTSHPEHVWKHFKNPNIALVDVMSSARAELEAQKKITGLIEENSTDPDFLAILENPNRPAKARTDSFLALSKTKEKIKEGIAYCKEIIESEDASGIEKNYVASLLLILMDDEKAPVAKKDEYEFYKKTPEELLVGEIKYLHACFDYLEKQNASDDKKVYITTLILVLSDKHKSAREKLNDYESHHLHHDGGLQEIRKIGGQAEHYLQGRIQQLLASKEQRAKIFANLPDGSQTILEDNRKMAIHRTFDLNQNIVFALKEKCQHALAGLKTKPFAVLEKKALKQLLALLNCEHTQPSEKIKIFKHLLDKQQAHDSTFKFTADFVSKLDTIVSLRIILHEAKPVAHKEEHTGATLYSRMASGLLRKAPKVELGSSARIDSFKTEGESHHHHNQKG
jgi:hypothetical protein